MKTTANKDKTQKSNILLAARKLFYEQGYKNTYLGQIADICGVTKPLISYHFNSKAALANKVAEAYIAENKNHIALKVYEYFFRMQNYDLQVSTAVEIHLTQLAIIQDKNVSRFDSERADDKYDEMYSQYNLPLYQIHDRRYKLNINHDIDEIAMISKAAPAAAHAVTYAYLKGELKCSLEECLDYVTALHFRLMRIDDERVDEIISKSNEIINTVHFEIAPYFKIL